MLSEMSQILPIKTRALGLHTVGFLLVTLAAYLSALITMGYVLNTISAVKATTLITLGVIYLANGVYGYSWARNASSNNASLTYLAIQIALAATLLFLARSPAIMLAMLPLAGQSVVLLPRRLMIAVCAVMWSTLAVPMAVFGGLGPAAVLGMFFLAGIIFVVVITRLAVKEQRARAEVERLLAELKEANQKLRAYADQVEELATISERNRLAREIHDSLGHYLTVVIVQIEAAMALMASDRDRSLENMRTAQSLAQKGLEEVRRSVGALRAARHESRSLVDSMNTLLDESRAAGISAGLRVIGTPVTLPPDAELTLYRAAQEGLTNVRRHSHAKNATVMLDYSKEHVTLTVEDDGMGATEPGKGFGLTGLYERAQFLGGDVITETAAEAGFTLKVRLPSH